MKKLFFLLFSLFTLSGFSQQKWQGKFEQLDQTLPTPNSYRSASGAPGVNYWQQRADYDIDVEINDETQLLTGKETITYFNNAPEILRFLWLQLDQNNLSNGNMTDQTKTNRVRDSIPAKFFPLSSDTYGYEGGFKIKSVKDATGKPLTYFFFFSFFIF